MHHGVHVSRDTVSRRSPISKFATFFVALGLLGGAAVVSAPPAAAAARWKTLPSPAPSGNTGTTLSGVDCPTTKSCFAVGKFSGAAGVKTLVEHWNGKRWGVLKSPNPSPTSSLVGVDCPSAKSCFAVGNYKVGAVQRTLIQHWNGSAWSVQPSPNPSTSIGAGLTGVACPSLKSCFAVGIFATSTPEIRTLVLHWNGNVWGTQPSVNPSSASVLNNIACPSVKSCFAVGNYTKNGAPRPFVEHWNGKVWGTLPSFSPSNSTGATFNNVACPSVSSCFAVGSYTTATTSRHLVEHWNGRAWGLKPNVTPTGANGASLNGIACPTTKSCFAVGNPSANRNFVEHYNGSAWAAQAVPSPGSVYNHLNSVACPDTSLCFAVGDYRRTAEPAHGLTLRYV